MFCPDRPIRSRREWSVFLKPSNITGQGSVSVVSLSTRSQNRKVFAGLKDLRPSNDTVSCESKNMFCDHSRALYSELICGGIIAFGPWRHTPYFSLSPPTNLVESGGACSREREREGESGDAGSHPQKIPRIHNQHDTRYEPFVPNSLHRKIMFGELEDAFEIPLTTASGKKSYIYSGEVCRPKKFALNYGSSTHVGWLEAFGTFHVRKPWPSIGQGKH